MLLTAFEMKIKSNMAQAKKSVADRVVERVIKEAENEAHHGRFTSNSLVGDYDLSQSDREAISAKLIYLGYRFKWKRIGEETERLVLYWD